MLNYYRKYKKYIWIFVYAASILFAGAYVYKYFGYFKSIFNVDLIEYFIAAFLLNIMAFFVMGSAWVFMVKRHYKAAYLPLLKSFYVSQLTRYVPGGIWSFVARFENGTKLGIPKSSTGYFLAVENINLIFVSFLFALLAIGVLHINTYLIVFCVIVLVSGAFGVLYLKPEIFRKVLNVFARRFKTEITYNDLSKKELFVVFLLFTLYWILFGMSFYFIAVALGANAITVLSAVGINAAAWLIGYLSFISPSGLGVREGIFVLLLSKYVSNTVGLSIALIARFIFTVSEIFGLLLILLYEMSIKKMRKYFKANYWRNVDKYWFVIIAILILYIIYFSVISIVRDHNLYSGRFDLGDMDQTVWNTIHGRIFQMTDPDSDLNISRMAYHSDVLLVLIAPLYWIYDSPYSLLVFQTIIIAIGAIPLYILAKKILHNKVISLALALSYLLYPALERVNFYDFHAVSLTITFFMFAFLFVYTRKYLWAFIFCLLAITTKEEIGLIVFMIGLYIIFKNKDVKKGIVFAVTGLVASFTLLMLVIPHFRPNDTAHFALIFYSKYGGDTPLKVLRDMLLHPFDLLKSIFDYSSIVYIYELLLPVGFVSVLSPTTAMLALSELGVNILSNNYYMKTIFLQYTSAIIPFIFIANIFGIKIVVNAYTRFYNEHLKRFFKLGFTNFAVGYILVFALVGNYFWGVLPFDAQNASYVFTPKEGTEEIAKLENEIPPQYSVSASNSLSPHFTHRKNSYTFPAKANSADFIVVLKNETFEIVDPRVITSTVNYLLQSNKYSLLYNKGNLYLFEKKGINAPSISL